MQSPEPLPAPLPNVVCPLCGGPNQCAPAHSGSFDSACWCTAVRIDAGALVQVDARDACLCAACANGARGKRQREAPVG